MNKKLLLTTALMGTTMIIGMANIAQAYNINFDANGRLAVPESYLPENNIPSYLYIQPECEWGYCEYKNGLLVRENRYENGIWEFKYDDNNNLREVVAYYEYDDVNGYDESAAIWKYDENGKLTDMGQANSPETVVYKNGQLDGTYSVEIPNNGTAEYTYENGKLKSGDNEDWTYNDQGLLTDVSIHDINLTYHFDYDENGNLTGQRYHYDQDGYMDVQTISFDENRHIVSELIYSRGDYDDTSYQRYYQYDAAISSGYTLVSEENGNKIVTDGENFWTYDQNGRLIKEGDTEFTYEYDDYGNIISIQTGNTGSLYAFNYADPNWKENIAKAQKSVGIPQPDGSIKFVDDNGKVRFEGKKIYTINEANQVAGKVNSVKIRYR